MVWRVIREGLPLPLTLQVLAARVAHARLLGAGSRNEISPAFKEHTRELEMYVMNSLVYVLGNEEAADQAAKSVFAVCGYSRKGPTIARAYPEHERSTPISEALAN